MQTEIAKPLTRRSLLGGGALIAAGLSCSSHLLAARSAAPPAPIRLGIASYTFRNFMRKELIGFLKQLEVSSLNAKDVKDHLPGAPDQEALAVAAYKAANIDLHAAGAIYFRENDEGKIRSSFEYCKQAGISVIVAGDPSLETLPRVEAFAKEYDMRIAIHNHGPEDPLWQSPLEILGAIKQLDRRIGCCIDVGHTVRAGTDVVAAIHAVGSRLWNVHMKDLTDFHDKDSQVPVGKGRMPVREIFLALQAIGYREYVDLEYEVHPEDPMPGVISSMAYMRGVLAGLGQSRTDDRSSAG